LVVIIVSGSMHANPFPFMEHFNTLRTGKSGLKLQLHNKRKETLSFLMALLIGWYFWWLHLKGCNKSEVFGVAATSLSPEEALGWVILPSLPALY